MSILAVNVALPLPLVAGLLVGPGLVVHTIAKQILARFDLKHDCAVCAFSAAVSGAVAFALIKSTAIVAVVALATFSVLLAYEYLRLESARPQPVNLGPVLEAIQEISQSVSQIDFSSVLTAIEQLPQEIDKKVDFESLKRAPASLEVPRHISEEGKAKQDLAKIKAKGNEVLDYLKRREETRDSAVVEALQALTVQVEALSVSQQVEAEGSVNQNKLDRVLQGIVDLKAAGVNWQDVPQYIDTTLDQVRKIAQQTRCIVADYNTTIEKTLQDLNAARCHIQSSLIELKVAGEANARVVKSFVPVGCSSMYGGSSYQWNINTPNVASNCNLQQRSSSRVPSNSYTICARQNSPDACANQGTVPMVLGKERLRYKVDNAPIVTQSMQVKMSTTAQPPQLVAGAFSAEGGSLKQTILAKGGDSLYRSYEDMNPKVVSRDHLNNPLAKNHFFVNQGLKKADSAAILHILDQERLKLDAIFIAIPEGLPLGFGPAKFDSLMRIDTSKLLKHSAMTLAAQDGQGTLLKYFIAAGASTRHVVEDRCYLGFAAAAGLVDIIYQYATSDCGIGQKVPLAFDAVCARDKGVTLRVLIQKGLCKKSINNLCACTRKHRVRIGQVVPRNVSVNAVHLAILLQDQVKVEALLGCDDVIWNQKTGGVADASPLLLLLNWVAEQSLDADHWAVQAAVAIIGKLKEKNVLTHVVIQNESGKWLRSEGRYLVQTPLQCAELIKGCTERTQAALNRALT